jgi:hypothetical protein
MFLPVVECAWQTKVQVLSSCWHTETKEISKEIQNCTCSLFRKATYNGIVFSVDRWLFKTQANVLLCTNLIAIFCPRWSEHAPMSPVEGYPTVFQAVFQLPPGIYQVPFFIPCDRQLLRAFRWYMFTFISCINISIPLPWVTI